MDQVCCQVCPRPSSIWMPGTTKALQRRSTVGVALLAAVRNLLFEPRNSPYNDDGTPRLADDDEVIAMCDVATAGPTAYLQADMFKPTDPARYLKVYDPVLGVLDGFGVSHQGLDKPTCHADMSELHADISSAAAEIFAASVAPSKLLHLGYVTSELSLSYPQPIMLEVNNATTITFSKDQVRCSKLRHIDCRQAWVKALCDERIVKLIKVDTHDNLAD